MKRPNFTQHIFLNIFSGIFKTTNVACSITALTLILLTQNIHAQVVADCNSILACNDGVQISLDNDCLMNIEPDMILEGQPYSNDYYDVEAKLPNGTSLPQFSTGNDAFGKPIRRVAINNTHIGKTLKVKVSLRGCGNSCWGDALIEDKLRPEVTVCPCQEIIDDFTGVIFGAGPSYTRPQGSICSGGAGLYTPTDYIVFQFAVDVTGIVDINLAQLNALFNVYTTAFDPLDPCTNLISPTNVRSFSQSLNAGTNYFLVVSLVTDGAPGAIYPITTLNIGSQVGNVKSSVSATVCTLACNGEIPLLAQNTTNAQSRPTFVDACGGVLTYKKSDFVENQQCSGPFSKIIRRDWTATDASGNVSDVKSQYFYIRRINLSEVICPADWITNCTGPYIKLPNGNPSPETTGFPSNLTCANIQYFYDDIVFDLCGAGVKISRQWTIIDWCTGQDKICAQLIKIEDNVAPVVSCPADLTSSINGSNPAAAVPTVGNTCKGNWDVLPPIAISDCSGVTWEVRFKKADASGNPPLGTEFTLVDGETSVVGTRPAFAATPISATARPYRIINLPIGRTWLKYTIIDECGNSSDCFTEIDVVDRTPPTAVCEGTTVVSLDASGWAELYATSVDDHSTDNCGVAKFEIRRKNSTCLGYASDLTFKEKINFCCSDVTSSPSLITVILRVYDSAGNYNDCETTVTVQNKIKPVITCPTSKQLACGDSRIAAWVNANSPRFDTTFFGKPSISGVCPGLGYGSTISGTLNSCGHGTIRRRWFVLSDPTVFCDQTLTVTPPTFSSSNINFPGTIELQTCNIDEATPEILNSKPTIINASTCSQIGISSRDQYFYYVPEACVKILRTWRIVDWCTYDASVGGPIYEQTQIIKLKGTSGATFTTPCTTQTYDTEPSRCDKEITFTTNATDGCTDDIDLVYTWALDLSKNNTVDFSGTGKTFTKILPAGTHKVTFTVTNKCGKVTTCSYDVIVRSTKKPTPVCYGEVVWVMESDGSAEIWASDFNLKSTSNCGSDANLKFAFDSAGSIKSKVFTCGVDIPNGQVARIPLKMYVIDASGAFDFCDVTLILQDSPLTNACTDHANLLPTIAGRIATETQEGMDGIEVELVNMVSSTEITDKTKNSGEYKLTGVDVFDPKSIAAYKNNDILNGVTTLDLVLIQRHILGIQKIESPYKLLSADINASRSITASDLVTLRKVILGVTNTFENNTSWRFIPSDYVFTDLSFPFDFPSKINLDSIYEDKDNVDFIAMKVGDVNSSAKANINSISSESRTQNTLVYSNDKQFMKGEKFSFTLKSSDEIEVIGAQMALHFDASTMAFNGIKSGAWDIKSEFVNVNNVQNGQILMSYVTPQGTNISSDQALFTIEFIALKNGSTKDIVLANDVLNAEMYTSDATVHQLNLQSRSSNANGSKNELFQNEPNPFKDNTKIAFNITKSENVILRIMDITGKVIYTVNSTYDKGMHVVNIANENLAKSGVYYYQLEAGDFTATKKMILIE